MPVNIAFIPKEQAEEARTRALALSKAVENGDMPLVDAETTRLCSFGLEKIHIPEAVWREFLAKVRTKGTFSATYLLDREQQEAVLCHEWDSSMDGIVRIVQMAYHSSGLVLELPLLEDGNDES